MAALGKVVSGREQEWVSEMLVKVFLELSAGYTGVFSLGKFIKWNAYCLHTFLYESYPSGIKKVLMFKIKAQGEA